jgi:hypothetical protein
MMASPHNPPLVHADTKKRVLDMKSCPGMHM